MQITCARVYGLIQPPGGHTVLVDGLWPRGLRKEDAPFDAWVKEAAPSRGLRQWYDHDPLKWDDFMQRYFAELDEKPAVIARLHALAEDGLTLVYASRNRKRNNAVALQAYLLDRRSP